MLSYTLRQKGRTFLEIKQKMYLLTFKLIYLYRVWFMISLSTFFKKPIQSKRSIQDLPHGSEIHNKSPLRFKKEHHTTSIKTIKKNNMLQNKTKPKNPQKAIQLAKEKQFRKMREKKKKIEKNQKTFNNNSNNTVVMQCFDPTVMQKIGGNLYRINTRTMTSKKKRSFYYYMRTKGYTLLNKKTAKNLKHADGMVFELTPNQANFLMDWLRANIR